MNKAEQERLSILSEVGCIPCMIQGDWSQATIQHVTSGGRRLKNPHMNTYSACPWHHLGQPDQRFRGSLKKAEAIFGPSFAHNKRLYIETYGPESELIRIADAIVRIILSARRKHEYLSQRGMIHAVKDLHREIVCGESICA